MHIHLGCRMFTFNFQLKIPKELSPEKYLNIGYFITCKSVSKRMQSMKR